MGRHSPAELVEIEVIVDEAVPEPAAASTVATRGRGARQPLVVVAVVVAVLAVLASIGGGSEEQPPIEPTSTVPALAGAPRALEGRGVEVPIQGDPLPQLAGHEVIAISSGRRYTIDLGTGEVAPAPSHLAQAADDRVEWYERVQRSLGDRGELLGAIENRIAIRACDDTGCRIEILAARGREPLAVLPAETPEERLSGPATFSPNGEHVALLSFRAIGSGVSARKIAVVDIATGERRDVGLAVFDEFVLLDGGEWLVSPFGEALLLTEVATGRMTLAQFGAPISAVERPT